MECSDSTHGAMLAVLAEAVERICAAEDLAGIAAAALTGATKLLSCPSLSFAAFELPGLNLLLQEQRGPARGLRAAPRLERSRDLATSLGEGAQLLTRAEGPDEAFYVLYEPPPDGGRPPCELRIPFYLTSNTLCILTLGKKESGTDYTPADIDALRVLVALLGSGAHGRSPLGAAGFSRRFPGIWSAHPRPESAFQLLGESESIVALREKIAQVAPTEASVLIRGESGTGKELVARAIHQQSRHAGREMVIVNCAALPEPLAESELFGHERGAFTGAVALKKGKFEFADQSTLFLDEIGDLDLTIQAKLLRFLQDGIYQRVGGQQNLRSRIRLISATNKELQSSMNAERFRSDLYYRINVVQIDLPPLRDHAEDIPLLAEYYARYFARKYGKAHQRLHPAISAWLQAWPFPGNVRELINIVERMIILGNGSSALATLPALPHAMSSPHLTSPQSLDALEKAYIQSVLAETRWNKSATARILGIARKTLREKIARYHLQ
ncbi:MAG TPA: sigma-54 dependent transcriptional regulator [bacterium]|nr:sigma-54 dependent transcriptional regulator [bacterium]HQI50157.1 sigma-54 dependent transcriptional regulator [bacterium]HQJ64593.1 sigma-54 dependent transcriptional regulator [bacterium]